MNTHSRVLSGMRPTGRLHLGHYHGVLKNWVQLQHEYDCFFFVADWHALTTHYEDSQVIAESVWDMVIDWLAAGVNPGSAQLFIQSHVPEHAELHLLLSMVTPLGWLERVPSYKDQQEKLRERDLATYGFLGYPLLQSADILIYNADKVPVGEDQVAHVELTREIARRFNHIYGREPGFEAAAEAAVKKMGKKNARLYKDLRRRYQEQGDHEALDVARALLQDQQNLAIKLLCRQVLACRIGQPEVRPPLSDEIFRSRHGQGIPRRETLNGGGRVLRRAEDHGDEVAGARRHHGHRHHDDQAFSHCAASTFCTCAENVSGSK